MRKQGQPLAVATPKATSSPMSVSLDMKVHNRTKVETDMPGRQGSILSYNGKALARWRGSLVSPFPEAERKRARKELKGHGGEATPPEFPAPHFPKRVLTILRRLQCGRNPISSGSIQQGEKSQNH